MFFTKFNVGAGLAATDYRNLDFAGVLGFEPEATRLDGTGGFLGFINFKGLAPCAFLEVGVDTPKPYTFFSLSCGQLIEIVIDLLCAV